ncbi:RNI-like protein [Mycena sp. CBHHK59/15]|nr:RNI-like protein [Mycena sp. CBHHK59/15]
MSTTFSLSNRRYILSSSEEVKPLIESVNVETVTSFSIDGNSIGADAAVALRELLLRMPGLQSANFSNIFSRPQKEEIPDTLATICDGLKGMTTLMDLDLSDNAIGAIAVGSLVPFLVENRSLRVLKINNVGFGPEAGTIVAKALHLSALLHSIHKQRSNLRAIICGQSRLENGSATAWSDAFACHTNLVAVHMSHNDIGEIGLTAIARGLENCRSLRYLNIADNAVRQESLDATRTDPDVDAATAFASALASWKDLEYLGLSDCCLGVSATSQIIDALSKGNNLKLRALLLDNASFDESFGIKLLGALNQALPNLVTLKLADHEGLDNTEDGVIMAKIDRIITSRPEGMLVLERDIEDVEDTVYLDSVLAEVITLPAAAASNDLIEAMAGMSVSDS